jgi:hypothetical protein
MLMDLLYLAASVAFFAVSVGLVVACERLRRV